MDLSIVTQTRDGGIKGGWYDVVKRDDRGTGYSYVVNPCLPKNRSIYRHREIFQDLPYPLPIASKSWCNLGQALLAYPTFYSNRAYYSTRVARILASSQREEQRERKEARGRIDARYEKFQKADSEKRVGRGMEKDPGSASEFEASRIARKAKLVGGNLSRVRIHLNPPLSPSLRFPRFLFRVTCRERSRLAVGEKRLKGESARRSAEIGSFYAGLAPADLNPLPPRFNKVNRLKAASNIREKSIHLSFDREWLDDGFEIFEDGAKRRRMKRVEME